MGAQGVADKTDIDPELVPGARNTIEVCLQLKPNERITIITDEATRDIATALQAEVERVDSNFSVSTLEHHTRYPLKFTPEIVAETYQGLNPVTS